MKALVCGAAVVLCFSAFLLPGSTVFKKLYALEGTWKMTTKRGVLCEEWKKIDDNYMQGKGYMIKGTDTIINERVALTNTKEGVLYTSAVEDQNNKEPIAFKMIRAENDVFVFENPAHDFPKRIVYRFVTSDSIHAFVDDGSETGKRQNFYYKKQ